jgi:hypothetical protein
VVLSDGSWNSMVADLGPEEKHLAMREVVPSGGAPLVWGGAPD